VDFAFLTRRGIPTTAIPAGTTLFLELHNNTQLGYIVQVWVWAPCIKNPDTGDEFHAISPQASYTCPAQLVKLDECEEQCPFDKFREIIFDKINKTGTWKDLCGEQKVAQILDKITKFKKLNKNHLHATKNEELFPLQNANLHEINLQSLTSNNESTKTILIFVTIIGAIGVLCYVKNRQRSKYTYIPDTE